jgi:hypothetical protein
VTAAGAGAGGAGRLAPWANVGTSGAVTTAGAGGARFAYIPRPKAPTSTSARSTPPARNHHSRERGAWEGGWECMSGLTSV